MQRFALGCNADPSSGGSNARVGRAGFAAGLAFATAKTIGGASSARCNSVPALMSTAGLLWVTQAAFFAALRHYYRKRDLIQRVSADTIGSFAWMKWLVTTSAATNAGLKTDTRR